MRVTIKSNNLFILFAACLTSLSLLAQPKLASDAQITGEQLKEMMANEDVLKEWIEQVQKPGVVVEGTSMVFSDEAKKLAKDEAYRASVYKEKYELTDIKESVEKFEIQKAFWRMINLYPENKELMLRFIYAYDDLVPADKLVTASFYTYAFFDPRITKIVDGKPDVYRPDLFEDYFRITKEIVAYIAMFREQEKSTK